MTFLIALFLTGLFSWLVHKQEGNPNAKLGLQIGGGAAMGTTWAGALGLGSFGVSFFVMWAICFGFLYAVPHLARRFL